MNNMERVAMIALTGWMAALPVLMTTTPAEAQGLRERIGGGRMPDRGGSSSNRDTKPSNDRDSKPASLPARERPSSPETPPSRQPERAPLPSFSSPHRGDRDNRITPRLGDRDTRWGDRDNDRPSLPTPIFGRDSRDGGFTLPPRGVLNRDSDRQTSGGLATGGLPPKLNPFRGNVSRPNLPDKLPPQILSGHFRNNARYFTTPGNVIVLGDYGNTLYHGYTTTYLPGQSWVSPYYQYNCPPYIGSSYVLTRPYAYAYGRELGSFRPYADNDRYYSADTYRGRTLRAALNDLTLFWEENDARALRRRVSPDFAVAVFQDERYSYSLRQRDFLGLSSDALDRVTTLSFRFDSVRDRSDGLINAYGTHVFRLRGDSTPRQATVRYTLVYVDGDWYVSALSMAPDIARSLP